MFKELGQDLKQEARLDSKRVKDHLHDLVLAIGLKNFPHIRASSRIFPGALEAPAAVRSGIHPWSISWQPKDKIRKA